MKFAGTFALAVLFSFSGWMWSRHYHRYLYETEFKREVDRFNKAAEELKSRHDNLRIDQLQLLVDYREVSCR